MATLFSILAWRVPWTESLVDDSPWGQKESDQTERLITHSLREDLAGSGSGASLEARP